MSYYKSTLAANAVWEISDAGKFMRLLETTGNVRVEFYRNGSRIAGIDTVQAGFWRRDDFVGFDKVRITDMSGASNTVGIVVDDAMVGYDRSAGSVSVTQLVPTRFTGANTQRTVTTASAQLVAAVATRSYLLIQNKDASGNIWINFNAAATQANGIKIGPGQSYELNCNITTNAIQAIGDIASNANIVTVEG